MGFEKNLSINKWIRHNEGKVDLKVEGMVGWCNPFQSNFGATKNTLQNFQLLSQCLKNS